MSVRLITAEKPAPLARSSLARVLVWGVLATVLLWRPPSAVAAWPVPNGRDVTLAFGASYAAPDGSTATHRGADLAVAAGARVGAPAGGAVTFAGRVPGPHGGSVLAVTLRSERGTVTLMPLGSLAVGKGDAVAEGAELGTVAADGDPSTAGAHVHVSARVGDLYVDPVPWLGAPAAPAPAADGATAEAPQAGAAPAPQGVGVPVAVPRGAALSPASAPAPSAVAPGEAAPAVTQGAAASLPAGATSRPAVAGAPVAPGVSVAGAAPATAGPAAPHALAAALAPALGQQAAGRVSALASRALVAVGRAARVGVGLAVGVLLALGCLWPLWRAGEGGVKVRVRPVADDVAAVPGR